MIANFRFVIALLACYLMAPQTAAAKDKPTLDAWMDGELIPSVVTQLTSHPRFADEVVRFVVMQDGKPSATTNALALALRDRLQDAVIDQSGMRVGWQVDRKKFDRRYEQNRVDCTTSEVHYYIGLELEELRSGRFTVSVRALDVDDQSWIPGFGEYWQGTLTTMQHRAYRQPDSDQAYLGQRTVPFDETQSDLLAAQIAHDLGCSLLRQMAGEYISQIATSNAEKYDEKLTLISNNLAFYRAIQIMPNDSGINSVIQAKAHHIDDDLYQYWVTITPVDADSDLPTISASAYIYQQETFFPASPASVSQSPQVDNSLRDPALIASLKIVSLTSETFCNIPANDSRQVYERRDTGEFRRCFALQAQTEQDAVILFLHHQPNNGLVRMADKNCSERSDARIARQGQPLLFPLTMEATALPSWLPGNDWAIEADADTYYAVASSNTKAARALARHFELLPKRCGYSMRPGLEGAQLRHWFRELETIANNWRSEIDWQSVRVRNVY